MRSPFKFLDAFTLQDKDAFFGRDQEVETLYSIVFKTPVLLVYGLSGTGKTSLVQCGLASKFDGPDWYPIFIRRNEDINVSTAQALRNALGDYAGDKLTENVSLLLRKSLRPVYLLFDQMEELFILGKEEEQEAFMESIRELLDAQLPAKIILIMREEYIGQLYHFEKLIPSLFDHRFRVEPMGPVKVKNVIRSSFEKFNIHLAAPEEELLEMMVSNITDPRSGIALPYLQVYLDMLYRDIYRKQYGEKSAPAEGYPRIDITRQEIDAMGKIGNVLERFLEGQIREIQRELAASHKHTDANTVQAVLDVFVSDEGTKRPVRFRQEGDTLRLADEVANIPAPVLNYILLHLQQGRILRRSDEYLELAHDSLAAVVNSRRSEAQRQLQNMRRRILHAYDEHQKTGAFLNQKQLASFEEYIPQLGLSKEVLDFLDKCEQEIGRLAEEDKARMQQESRMAQQRRLYRTRGIWLMIASGLAGLAAYMAWQSSNRATQLKEKSEALETESHITKQQRDSIANIIAQVDQQFGRMDSIMTGNLPQSELVKTMITLKSLVSTDTPDTAEIAENYISAIRVFTTSRVAPDLKSSERDTVLYSSNVNLVLHLRTPQPMEWIQVKWLNANDDIAGEPSYLQVREGPDGEAWAHLTTVLKEPGRYRARVFNITGAQIGRTRFRIADARPGEVSMTGDSEFRTMASGSLNAPGPEVTTFRTGQMIHYWFRINSPKANEAIYVRLADAQSKTVWEDDFKTGVNTDRGFRGWKYHGARNPGKYRIMLLNSKREELAGHEITIE